MESLFKECPECGGCGYVTIDLNDTHIPYEQKEVDYTCMSCDGKGCIILQEDIEDRIGIIEDMIQGMETRIEIIAKSAYLSKKGLLHELSDKYLSRVDTLTRGLYRLKQYKKKLLNLA